jgi:hypothetical protein
MVWEKHERKEVNSMKKILVILAGLSLVLGMMASAHAVPTSFQRSFDWDATVDETGRTWKSMTNPDYSFRMKGFRLPENAVIQRVRLFLVHKGNNPNREAWALEHGGKRYRLEGSSAGWRTQSIILDRGSFSRGLNPLLFTLREWTSGKDCIGLDKAVFKLRFCYKKPPYDPPRTVPEPATLLLFGSGFIGLAVWGRRKSRKG